MVTSELQVDHFDLRFVNRDVVDVFFGLGWNNWARFDIRRIKGKIFLNKIGGRPIPNQLFSKVCLQLEVM
jgi:hypothetical protein